MGEHILAERALLVEFGLAIDPDSGADPAALLAALRAAGARRARTPSQQPLFEAVFAMTGADFSQPIHAAPPYAALGHALDMLRQQLQQDFVHAEQFSALLEAMPLQIVIAQPDGTIRDANHLAATALPEPRPASLQALLGAETLSEGMAAREIQQGSRTVLMSVGSIRLSSGTLAGWVCTGVDVSLQAEARAALEEARSVAEAALRARTAFLQSISHEIRTPLSAIQAAAEALRHEALNADARPLIEAIRSSGAELSEMVASVLDAVGQEAGQLSIVRQPTMIRPLLMARIQAENITVMCEFSETLPPLVQTDPRRLEQLLGGLLSTAPRHLLVRHDQGALIVEAEECSGAVPEADSRLAVQLGGVLSSRAGGRCVLRLPCAALSQPEAEDTPLDGVRVLVVDDHPINRLVAERLLRSQGAEVCLADSGAEALRQLEAGGISVVLMDCLMPEMDGYEATRRHRRWEAAQPGSCRVPIVALTASATGDELARCVDAGMDGLLEKPLDLPALVRQLTMNAFNFPYRTLNEPHSA